MKEMGPIEFKEFLYAQCQEIMKYKWCLGVQLQHDPLLDKTMEEIGHEWIQLFARQYREKWKNESKDKS